MSQYYRYKCSLEDIHVYETRADGLPPPSVCRNDGAAIVAGTLTMIDEPMHFGDVEFDATEELDLTNGRLVLDGATVEGLSHNSLTDIGSKSHVDLDAHLDDASIHFQIDDSSAASNRVWLAYKVNQYVDSTIVPFATHLVDFANPHNVSKQQVGLGNVANLKQTLDAVVPPSSTDDSSKGYDVGSLWVDTATLRAYLCSDATVGAAVWLQSNITQHSDLSGIGTHTHDEIDTHLNSDALHRQINDASTGSAALWSASKISAQLATKAATSHTHAASDIVSGTLADARVAQSNVTQHEAAIDHNALSNYSSNRHVDHSAVSISAGVGLSGGGTIASSRTLALDINGLTTDGAPSSAADYVATYDASAGAHKKVLISALLAAAEAGGSVAVSQVSSTVSTSTCSSTYGEVNSMSTVPAAGNYVVTFSCSGAASKSSAHCDYAIYVGDAMVADSRRIVGAAGNNRTRGFVHAMFTQALVTVSGAQSVNVRYRCDKGSFTMHERSMILIKY